MDVLESAGPGPLHGHRYARHRRTRTDRRGNRGPLADRAAGPAAGRRHRRPLGLFGLAASLALLAPGVATAADVEPLLSAELAISAPGDSLLALRGSSSTVNWSTPFTTR